MMKVLSAKLSGLGNLLGESFTLVPTILQMVILTGVKIFPEEISNILTPIISVQIGLILALLLTLNLKEKRFKVCVEKEKSYLKKEIIKGNHVLSCTIVVRKYLYALIVCFVFGSFRIISHFVELRKENCKKDEIEVTNTNLATSNSRMEIFKKYKDLFEKVDSNSLSTQYLTFNYNDFYITITAECDRVRVKLFDSSSQEVVLDSFYD